MKGFSLIELLVTMSIIIILAAVSLYIYRDTMIKARYTELVNAAAPYQQGIAFCFQQTQDMNQCNHGQNGIPNAYNSNQTAIQSITVNQGVITLVPQSFLDITASDSLIYNPTVETSGMITWRASGNAIAKSYVSQ